jgi:hypothetical protein
MRELPRSPGVATVNLTAGEALHKHSSSVGRRGAPGHWRTGELKLSQNGGFQPDGRWTLRVAVCVCTSAMQSIKIFRSKELWKNQWLHRPRKAQSKTVHCQYGHMRKSLANSHFPCPKFLDVHSLRKRASSPTATCNVANSRATPWYVQSQPARVLRDVWQNGRMAKWQNGFPPLSLRRECPTACRFVTPAPAGQPQPLAGREALAPALSGRPPQPGFEQPQRRS